MKSQYHIFSMYFDLSSKCLNNNEGMNAQSFDELLFQPSFRGQTVEILDISSLCIQDSNKVLHKL